MTLATIIRDRTNDGADVVDFLVAVMRDEFAGFKPCHRLDAAKLLVRYDCTCRNPAVEGNSALAERDEALNFTLDYTPDPSRPGTGSGSSGGTEFEQALARVIRKSTDDGRSVCRFLINVMEGELKAFKPHHRISAARELLSRGFSKQALQRPPLPQGEGWGEGEKTEGRSISSHSSTSITQTPKSEKSPNHTNHSNVTPYSDTGSDDHQTDWDEVNRIVDEAIERSERLKAEQPEPDADNPPYPSDLSVFDEAMENSLKWFEDWKNSLDPQEYQAIIKQTAANFGAKLDTRIERRKQIKKDHERREKEEAEHTARQASARAEAREKEEAESAAAKEIEDLGPPPSREEHERWSPTPSIPTSFRLVNCGHPKCKLHDGPIYYPEDDRNSPYYGSGNPHGTLTSRIYTGFGRHPP